MKNGLFVGEVNRNLEEIHINYNSVYALEFNNPRFSFNVEKQFK